ncbi:MAG: hypothetical protein Kow0065_24250 [Methylomicrobium sp.]
MKIEQSHIQLSAQHRSVQQSTREESLTLWVGSRRPETSNESAAPRAGRLPPDQLTLSPEGQAAAEAAHAQAEIDPEKELENDPRYQIIKRMVEALTGHKINLRRIDPIKTEADPIKPPPNQASVAHGNVGPRSAGFGLEYERRETYYEAEQTAFSARGLIRTADGKEIAFNLELAMSREYVEESSISLRAGDAVMKDPLVINFAAESAQLTDMKFAFDLTADGNDEQISFVGHGSGFLALDLNGDGAINNGRELFGPATGNGFDELAAYDQDGNQWIDENDAVFDRLRIWTKDSQGNDELHTLADKNVGAIYLGNVGTPFELKNSQNRLDGRVLTSSVYLDETGKVGTVQQIDLAV